MTSRTHDLFAFTSIVLAIAYYSPIPHMTMATAVVSLAAAFLGGLAPDLDESTASLWQRLPAGSGTILGKIIAPIFGSHRFLSHSLAGVALFGYVVRFLLQQMSGFLLVNMDIVWIAFMLGFISHLAADAITREGIPLFFPIPWKLGFPPVKFLRFKTGSWGEKIIVFPALLFFNGYLIYSRYPVFLSFIRSLKT